ncbi:MAG: SURF1 family cytochrome oxidase biogenesis protein [Alphaproteobacteria bacterium]
MKFRPLPILTLAALMAIAVLVTLGNWQWGRYQEKKTAQTAGIQRVTLVSFEPVKGQIQLVYGLSDGKPVWRIFAPVRSDQEYTFIDVGAVPGLTPPDWKTIKEPFDGKAAIRGAPVRTHAPSIFESKPDLPNHVWYAVDLPAMVKAVGGKVGTPFYVAAPYIGPDGATTPNPTPPPMRATPCRPSATSDTPLHGGGSQPGSWPSMWSIT